MKYGAEEPAIAGHENGYFMIPKIFECSDGLTISKEEVFGPLLQLYKFDTEEEVFRRANQTELGLAAGIFTNDFHRIQRFKDTIEVPVINNPFTRYKTSGPLGKCSIQKDIFNFIMCFSVINSIIMKIPHQIEMEFLSCIYCVSETRFTQQ